MRTVCVSWIPVALMVVLAPQAARADMGAIVPAGNVDISEPGQKAILAHDGFEEILILSTDLELSAPGSVLRFIPFPCEPSVSAAPSDCFAGLADLVLTHNLRYVHRYRSQEDAETEPVEIRSQQRLGAHDVTVVRVRNADHFATWANEFFAGKGLPQRKLTDKEARLVSEYVDGGFAYFVFDLVELGPETRSADPLLYRFPSGHVYYPLKTANLFGGDGRIELFVFSDVGLLDLRCGRYNILGERVEGGGLPYALDSETALVSAQEMEKVCPAIAELLGRRALLQAFRYDGPLSFKEDVWCPVPVRETKVREPRPRDPDANANKPAPATTHPSR